LSGKLKQVIMKRIVVILTVALSFMLVMPAQAQLKFGVKGGLNLAGSLSDTWEKAGDTKSYTGFFIGPMIDFKIPLVGLGVDAALMYSQKGNKLAGETLKEQGIDIPVNLKYSIGLGGLASIFFAAGPDFFFNFNKDDKLIENVKLNYKKAQVGINLGVGVKLFSHLQVGVNYNMPFTDSAKANISDGASVGDIWNAINGKSYKTKVWQVSLAYLF